MANNDFNDVGFSDFNDNEYNKADEDLIYNDKKNNGSKKENGDSPASMELYDWVQCLVAALLCGILIFMFIGRIIGVDGSSMFPTLHHTDKIITSNLFYEPDNGDIIVLQTDSFSADPLVKRIIATEGQTIDIDFETGTVYVDGEALEEDYIADLTYTQEDFTGEMTVPEGCVFVMGDNRNASTDSRTASIGMVDERCIIGKVYFVLIPGKEADGSRDWSRIGSVYN